MYTSTPQDAFYEFAAVKLRVAFSPLRPSESTTPRTIFGAANARGVPARRQRGRDTQAPRSTASPRNAVVPAAIRPHLLGRLTSHRRPGWWLRSGPTLAVGATFSPCRSKAA